MSLVERSTISRRSKIAWRVKTLSVLCREVDPISEGPLSGGSTVYLFRRSYAAGRATSSSGGSERGGDRGGGGGSGEEKVVQILATDFDEESSDDEERRNTYNGNSTEQQ